MREIEPPQAVQIELLGQAQDEGDNAVGIPTVVVADPKGAGLPFVLR
jgi:hypothetical protein